MIKMMNPPNDREKEGSSAPFASSRSQSMPALSGSWLSQHATPSPMAYGSVAAPRSEGVCKRSRDTAAASSVGNTTSFAQSRAATSWNSNTLHHAQQHQPQPHQQVQQPQTPQNMKRSRPNNYRAPLQVPKSVNSVLGSIWSGQNGSRLRRNLSGSQLDEFLGASRNQDAMDTTGDDAGDPQTRERSMSF